MITPNYFYRNLHLSRKTPSVKTGHKRSLCLNTGHWWGSEHEKKTLYLLHWVLLSLIHSLWLSQKPVYYQDAKDNLSMFKLILSPLLLETTNVLVYKNNEFYTKFRHKLVIKTHNNSDPYKLFLPLSIRGLQFENILSV